MSHVSRFVHKYGPPNWTRVLLIRPELPLPGRLSRARLRRGSGQPDSRRARGPLSRGILGRRRPPVHQGALHRPVVNAPLAQPLRVRERGRQQPDAFLRNIQPRSTGRSGPPGQHCCANAGETLKDGLSEVNHLFLEHFLQSSKCQISTGAKALVVPAITRALLNYISTH